ncbi:MAG: patatin-like phospholipase family protein [Candidatus Cloacimonetes bacterium]|nr:patatin-like phospholipase family protein [Candidatus Cloacimonadota bacterium]
MKIKNILVLMILLIVIFLHSEEKVGLALSGGGARGLAHIGILKVIDELNIKVDYIAGTSMGAVVGGLYAMGYSATEIEEMILKNDFDSIFDEAVSREDLYIGQKRWMPYANYYFDLDDRFRPGLPEALFSGSKLINTLFDYTYTASNINNFNEFPIKFKCVATNIITGEMKVFDNGNLHEVMRASMSAPSILEPMKLDDELYIDGGIRANLPSEIVKEMGADIIIGFQLSSELRSKGNLNNLIKVLDQTINFSMTDNVKKSIDLCDILIKPELLELSNYNFNNIKEIIDMGEIAARKHIEQLKILPKQKERKYIEATPNKIKFIKISVVGNEHLSNAKIKEYVGLKTSSSYSKKEILQAINGAYNSQYFKYIYPVINYRNEEYELILKVKERNRKRLGLALSSNTDQEVVVGLTLELNNYIQHNSKLLINAQVGDKNELNVDYVKNFGKHWGIYFRTFPYVKEQKLYSYGEDHTKTNSVYSVEYGATSGIGFYARNSIAAELYGYTYRSRLYKHIGEFKNSEFYSSGLGIKLYHESLNDYIFPTQGVQFLAKLSTAREGVYSEIGNKKFYSKLRMLMPFSKIFSIKYQFEYGSHFDSKEEEFDPFYIGGIDSFMGLYPAENSAAIYKINTIAMRFNPIKNLFCDIQLNVLQLGNIDYWTPEDDYFRAVGIKLGYKTFLGSLRIGFALDEDEKKHFYFSFGHNFDPFEFSRR